MDEIKGELTLHVNSKISSLREELIEMFEYDFNKVIHDMDSDFNIKIEKLNKKVDTKNLHFEIREKLIELDRQMFELGERISKLTRQNYELKTRIKEFLQEF